MRISEVLRGKTIGEVVTIGPDESVRALLATLAEFNIGALLVVEGERLAGIVSERDVVRALAGDALAEQVLDGPLRSIMTEVVHHCGQETELNEAMRVMTEHRVRHLPILEDGRLVGVISIGDVVKSRISELEFERDQLDSYLHQT